MQILHRNNITRFVVSLLFVDYRIRVDTQPSNTLSTDWVMYVNVNINTDAGAERAQITIRIEWRKNVSRILNM